MANALERAAILVDGEEIDARHLAVVGMDAGARRGTIGPEASLRSAAPATARTLEEIERAAIEEALASAGGNRRAAAERLGIGLRTLYEKLEKYRGE